MEVGDSLLTKLLSFWRAVNYLDKFPMSPVWARAFIWDGGARYLFLRKVLRTVDSKQAWAAQLSLLTGDHTGLPIRPSQVPGRQGATQQAPSPGRRPAPTCHPGEECCSPPYSLRPWAGGPGPGAAVSTAYLSADYQSLLSDETLPSTKT